MALRRDLFLLNIVILIFSSRADGYSLCESKASPNCNGTKIEIFHSAEFIWNKGSMRETRGSLFLQGSCLLAIMLTSILGNGALIATVVFEVRFRTPTNFLVIGQCLADLLFALTVVLLGMISSLLGDWKLSGYWCTTQVFFNRFFLMLTFSNFTLLAVDRYIVIVKNKSRNRFDKKQIFVFSTLLWIICIAMALPWDFFIRPTEVWFEVTSTFCLSRFVFPVEQNSALLIFIRLAIFMVLPALIVIYCFYHIFGIVRTNRRKVGPSTVSNWRKIAVAVHAKSAYTSIVVVISFALCILPFLLAFGMTIIGKRVTYAAMAVTKCIYYANTTIKPLIYISRNVPWSRKLRQLFTRTSKKRTVARNSPAVRRSKYAVHVLQQRKGAAYISDIRLARMNSRRRQPDIDFYQLFSIDSAKQAWDGRNKEVTTSC